MRLIRVSVHSQVISSIEDGIKTEGLVVADSTSSFSVIEGITYSLRCYHRLFTTISVMRKRSNTGLFQKVLTSHLR